MPRGCSQAWALTELTHLAILGAVLGLSPARLTAWLAEPSARIGDARRRRRPPQMQAFWSAMGRG